MSASGGVAPYTFTAAGLPNGISLNPNTGLISGIPTVTGLYLVTVTATDSRGCTTTRDYRLLIRCPPSAGVATDFRPPRATVGENYNVTVPVSGSGGEPLVFSAEGLPPGLSIDASTGLVSGTPTTAGEFYVTFRTTDRFNCSFGLGLAMVVECPTGGNLDTAFAFPRARAGQPYTVQVPVEGSAGTSYTYGATGLPPGLSINPNTGVISGTPTAAGDFRVQLETTDSFGCGFSMERLLTVSEPCAPVTLGPAALADAVAGQPYRAQLTASGIEYPYFYLEDNFANLPGLSLTSEGILSGTPTTPGTYRFEVAASDFRTGCKYVREYTLVVVCPEITISPGALPQGTVGQNYEATLSIGGTNSYTLRATGLPPGLSIEPSFGLISGTPTQNGTFRVEVTATDDNNGCRGSRVYEIVINCATIVVGPQALPVGLVGQNYSVTLTANGGAAPYTFNIAPAALLPPGLTFDPNARTIAGTPTFAGTYQFEVTAIDRNGCRGSRVYTLVVNCTAVITLNPEALPFGTVNRGYAATVAAGGGAAPYTFSVSAGVLPRGLSLDRLTGEVSGIPNQAGAFSFQITAIDRNNCRGVRNYSIVIYCPTININPANLPDGLAGRNYSVTLTAEGSSGPYTFAAAGLPGGLNLDAGTGAITGVPAQAGVSQVMVNVTDRFGCMGTRTYTLVINDPSPDPEPTPTPTPTSTPTPTPEPTPTPMACGMITLTPEELPEAVLNLGYSFTLTALGGAPPHTYSAQGLPAGLDINPSRGVISGTPTQAGQFEIQVTATDSLGCSITETYKLMVAEAGGATSVGENVVVSNGPVSVTFGGVAAAGTTSVTPINPASAGAVPGGYALAGTNFAFNITTTASVSPPITVCFRMPGVDDPAAFSLLRVLHGEGGALVDRTVLAPDHPAPDFDTRTLCARTSSLSPFVLARKTSAPTLQFASASFAVGEGDGEITINVTRAGDSSFAAAVEYETSDGTASERSDYTTVLGRLDFAPGETLRTFRVLVNDDAKPEGVETITLRLRNPAGDIGLGATHTATLDINDDDSAAPDGNPIDDAREFVENHYRDFLNRPPDPAGLAFWTGEITACGADAACVERKRVHVSAAFFLSIEFQQTGFLVQRLYRAAFARTPQFREYVRDMQAVSSGVVVGQGDWERRLVANRHAYVEEFTTRPAFRTQYPATMSAAQFVYVLNLNVGDALSAQERAALVAALESGSLTRGEALLAVAEDADFARAEFNRAFVLSEYFGYLRRNAQDAPDYNLDGFNFWQRKLEEFDGDFLRAEMVKAFINSAEYRGRFGRP